MSKKGVWLNKRAVRDQLLMSDKMADICLGYAEQVANQASRMTGEEFTADVQKGETRVTAMAKPASGAANRKNLQENALLKALGGIHGN